mgnify:FL=1
MSIDVSLRNLVKTDHDRWKILWTDYLDFYKTTVGDQVYKSSFQRLVSNDLREYQGIVADVEGETIGFAHYLFHRNLWSTQDTCYLSDLYVVPEMRGKGIARKLIHKITEHAQDCGVKGIYWNTQETNYKGRMLYDQVAKKAPFIVYEIE